MTIGSEPLLEVTDLKTWFRTDDRVVRAVDGVSLSVDRGRTLGVVGESGSGKSVTALSIMGLVPQPPGIIAGGTIRLGGRDLLKLPPKALRDLRGDEMAMIFQEPMTSLNPAFTVADQIIEGIRRHRPMTPREARARALEMLKRVRIPSAEERLDQYPHELSGGMRQRVMIAMAMSCDPKLLIADEPTTALDVTIQAQILDLLRRLRDETGTAIILITHDLGVVAEIADDVIVMYAGQVVEAAPVIELFENPQSPYTIGLLSSMPKLNERRARLMTIEGMVPDMAAPPAGCRFHTRCPFATQLCVAEAPPLRAIGPNHRVACHYAPVEELAA